MPPEFWLAISSGVLTGGAALCIVLIKYTFRRNNNSRIPITANTDCVSGNDCEERMESQKELFNSKLETVHISIDNVHDDMLENRRRLDIIETKQDTLVSISGEIKAVVDSWDERRRKS